MHGIALLNLTVVSIAEAGPTGDGVPSGQAKNHTISFKSSLMQCTGTVVARILQPLTPPLSAIFPLILVQEVWDSLECR